MYRVSQMFQWSLEEKCLRNSTIILKIKKIELSSLCRNMDENVHRFALSTEGNFWRERKRSGERQRKRDNKTENERETKTET